MTNYTQKSNNNRHIYTAIIVILLCAAFYSFVRSCGNGVRTAEIHQRTDTTVERIEKEHTVVGSEPDNVTGQFDSARAAISRADGLVERSQECVIRNTENIIEC